MMVLGGQGSNAAVAGLSTRLVCSSSRPGAACLSKDLPFNVRIDSSRPCRLRRWGAAGDIVRYRCLPFANTASSSREPYVELVAGRLGVAQQRLGITGGITGGNYGGNYGNTLPIA